MTQDFAKKKRAATAPPPSPPRWSWFMGGFLSGAFISFLLSLWLIGPDRTATLTTETPKAQPKAKVEEMQWDFYEIFPKSVVPIVEEYTSTGNKIVVDNSQWILQAGSFKNANDADERRAALLLLGLNVTTQSVQVSGETWHRVIVGPFDTQVELGRAQNKLAQASISAMPVKVPRT